MWEADKPLVTWNTMDLWWALFLFIIGEKKGQGRSYKSGGVFGLCVDPRLSEVSFCLGWAAQLQFPVLCNTLHPWKLCHPLPLQKSCGLRNGIKLLNRKQKLLNTCGFLTVKVFCYSIIVTRSTRSTMCWHRRVKTRICSGTTPYCDQHWSANRAGNEHQALCCTGHSIQLEEGNLKWPPYYFKSHLVTSPC